MEIMFSNSNIDFIKNKHTTGLYGDKQQLLFFGVEFEGIVYDDEWTVKRFLNGVNIRLDDRVLEMFSDLKINLNVLNIKIRLLSKCQFKYILLIYALLNNYKMIVFDYFDKGLSLKNKKRIINYLKIKYNGTLLVISNDLIFLSLISDKIIIIKNNKIIYNDIAKKLFNSNLIIENPPIIDFIKTANKKGANLDYTMENKELLKDIYRSVK